MEIDNKLIAIFMGLETPDEVYFEHLSKEGHRSELTHFMLLNYHNSWDWLMPVLDKIGTLVENISTHQSETFSGRWYQYTISFYNYKGFSKAIIIEIKSDYTNAESKLDTYYRAVIEFINWYNNQPK